MPRALIFATKETTFVRDRHNSIPCLAWLKTCSPSESVASSPPSTSSAPGSKSAGGCLRKPASSCFVAKVCFRTGGSCNVPLRGRWGGDQLLVPCGIDSHRWREYQSVCAYEASGVAARCCWPPALLRHQGRHVGRRRTEGQRIPY